MEITTKIRDMIMSDDVELWNLVNVMLEGHTTFNYVFENNSLTVGLPKNRSISSVREVVRLHIKYLEMSNSKIPN